MHEVTQPKPYATAIFAFADVPPEYTTLDWTDATEVSGGEPLGNGLTLTPGVAPTLPAGAYIVSVICEVSAAQTLNFVELYAEGGGRAVGLSRTEGGDARAQTTGVLFTTDETELLIDVEHDAPGAATVFITLSFAAV